VLEQFQKGHLRRKDYKADDAIDVEMQCEILVIVSLLCQFDIHRKVILTAHGANYLHNLQDSRTGLEFKAGFEMALNFKTLKQTLNCFLLKNEKIVLKRLEFSQS